VAGVPEITSEELVQRVESGEPIRVLDIRAPEALAGGKIDVVSPDGFLNIRGSEIYARGDGFTKVLAPNGPVAVVCGQGNSSKEMALHLNEMGFHAVSVRGGMAAWANAEIQRTLQPPPGFDHFLQFDRVAKGNLGYLLASGGKALLVDPPRKMDAFLKAAKDLSLDVIGAADTHAHADYISGGPMIARSLGVPYYLHPNDAILPYDGTPAKIPFTALQAGVPIRVGNAEVAFEHTPGHTEGSVTYLAGDVALTGDFIFIRSVGRPDLGGKLDEWTPVLWRSIERAKKNWNRSWRIYPAHYASEAERLPDRTVGSDFALVLEANEPLRIETEPEFVAWVKARVGTSPDAYRKIKTVNLGLLDVWDMEAQELESGRNACALG